MFTSTIVKCSIMEIQTSEGLYSGCATLTGIYLSDLVGLLKICIALRIRYKSRAALSSSQRTPHLSRLLSQRTFQKAIEVSTLACEPDPFLEGRGEVGGHVFQIKVTKTCEC